MSALESLSVDAKFVAKLKASGGCLLWTGATIRGYGSLRRDTIHWYAHRYSLHLAGRPLRYGMVVDHICRNPLCVNPDHLREMTIGENVLIGNTISARNAAKTHCSKGHLYSSENTRIDHLHRRVCITCKKASDKSWYLKKVASK